MFQEEIYSFLKDLYESDDTSLKLKKIIAHSLLTYPDGNDYVFNSLQFAGEELTQSHVP